MRKLSQLKEIICRYNKIAIAYSGGVDSSFLLFFTKKIARRDPIAFTAVSETYTDDELSFARSFAKGLRVRHIIIRTNEFKNKRFLKNVRKRCFYCKSELFSEITKFKKRLGFEIIFDGTNLTDRGDFRPGSLARKSFNVISPLEQAGIAKEEIRIYSRRFEIKGYDRQSNSCLASRIPYGTPIDKKIIQNIARIEKFLKKLNINTVRLRHHNEIARIETSINDMKKVLLNRDKIIKKIKTYGYKYVTLDIEGYRTGSMNLL